jgi:biopolymer transport protein ExbD
MNYEPGWLTRCALIGAFLVAFAPLAMGQRAAGDELKVRISTDGTCNFLDTSIPCAGLGDRLKSMKLANNGLHIEIDDGVQQEVVDATFESLWRAGFKKIGYVSNEIFR